MKKQKFNIRAFFSVLSFFSLVLLTLTGVGLFIAPHDHAADWLSWGWMGINQDIFADIHIVFSLVFMIGVLGHILYNLKTLVHYLKRKPQSGLRLNETSLAVLVTIFLFIGTLIGLPGPASVIQLGEKIQQSWTDGYPVPPIPNTESLTIEQLGRLMELDPEDILSRFRAMGIQDLSRHDVLEDIAEENNIPPYKLFSAIR